jgi:transcriptional regulator with XRE-family HTH domain
MTLGEKLKMLRENHGWTQAQAAEKLGISSQVVSNYERDYRSPDKEILSTISHVYNCSLDWLLGVSDESERKDVKTGGRAYYGGGDNLTDEDKAIANKKFDEIRNKIYIQHPDGFRVFITPDEEKYLMEQLKMYKAFKKQEDK